MEDRGKAEEAGVALELLESARHVVRGEKMREDVSAADLLARLQVAVEGDGAPAPEKPPNGAALEREVESSVELVALEPGIENVRVAAPDLA